MNDALFILAIGVLVLLFGGDQDIADALRDLIIAKASCK